MIEPWVDIQRDYAGELPVPADEQLSRWCVLAMEDQPAEVTLRLVDEAESQALNHQYRGKDKPTNVLSFPAEVPEAWLEAMAEQLQTPLLGDLILCVPVIVDEAKQQGKTLEAHFAHMVVHGTLHLRGYDHIEPEQASVMEALECHLLQRLSIANPYQSERGLSE